MRHILLVAALLLAPALARAGDGPAIAVVKSDSLGPYATVISGFSGETRGSVREYDLKDDPKVADKVFAELKEHPPALVFALGPLAANSAKRTFADVPVLFALVPNYEKYGLEGKNVTGIALSRPMRTQLETLKALAPSTRRVGVVFNPKYSKPVIEEAAGSATGLGLNLVQAKVDTSDDVPGAVHDMAEKVDAVWMIPDRSVATADAVKSIIRVSMAQKLPVFALTESQVKEGALVALSPNYSAIGQQAARIANRIVFEKVNPGALAVAMPEGLDVVLNLTTAKKLGVECGVAMDILKFAAKQGYPIKVYE